jgi:hypothetical protein
MNMPLGFAASSDAEALAEGLRHLETSHLTTAGSWEQVRTSKRAAFEAYALLADSKISFRLTGGRQSSHALRGLEGALGLMMEQPDIFACKIMELQRAMAAEHLRLARRDIEDLDP